MVGLAQRSPRHGTARRATRAASRSAGAAARRDREPAVVGSPCTSKQVLDRDEVAVERAERDPDRASRARGRVGGGRAWSGIELTCEDRSSAVRGFEGGRRRSPGDRGRAHDADGLSSAGFFGTNTRGNDAVTDDARPARTRARARQERVRLVRSNRLERRGRPRRQLFRVEPPACSPLPTRSPPSGRARKWRRKSAVVAFREQAVVIRST